MPTGYLSASESQMLLREGQPKPPPEEQAEQEMEMMPPPAVEPPPAIPVPVPVAAAPAPPTITVLYSGSLSGSGRGGVAASLAPVEADLQLAGRQLTGRLVHPVCGALPVLLAVDAAGVVSGNLRLYESDGCATNAASARGRMTSGSLTLDLRSAEVGFSGTLPARSAQTATGPASLPGLRGDVP
jgi:hypothetical protein